MTIASPASLAGRPRGFDAAEALGAALAVFWRQGYAATSLDALTAAMGLSRSSFYAAFGSKHDVLLAALTSYADGLYARLQGIAAAQFDPLETLRAALHALAWPGDEEQGCFLVNSIAELAPHDRAVCELARQHVERVTELLKNMLARAGHPPGSTASLSGVLLACVFGIVTLRKAGVPGDVIADSLARLDQLALTDR